ncbi:pheromone-binding protein Gp-9-like isoform X2 [Anoplolepis gracilipes]|uniref:pheromone-binding protein Gp-9-like isoform X2 n=1 Tax=Anoplolepis gracilipes TaxID=354296 RepID=UPI003BA10474
MKNHQLLFVFCLFLTATIVLSDDFTEGMAQLFSMSKIDVQICINKTDVKIEDFRRMDQLVDDSVETIDIDKSALKVGCLFACLFQKKEVMSDAHFNEKRLKDFFISNLIQQKTSKITIVNQICDTCIDRVRSKTEACEVTLRFILCLIVEWKSGKYE